MFANNHLNLVNKYILYAIIVNLVSRPTELQTLEKKSKQNGDFPAGGDGLGCWNPKSWGPSNQDYGNNDKSVHTFLIVI